MPFEVPKNVIYTLTPLCEWAFNDTQYCYAECRKKRIMLSVVMLIVVAPYKHLTLMIQNAQTVIKRDIKFYELYEITT